MMTNELIKAVVATVQLSDTLAIDGYLMPNEEFRAGIVGTSVLLGYQRDWFLVLPSKAPKKLKALQAEGFRYSPLPVAIQRKGRGGATKAQTISLKELTLIIAVEANAGNKRAIAIQSAFTFEGVESRFRDAFGKSQLSPDVKRKIFGMTFEEYLEALADNKAELEVLRLPGDSLYYFDDRD